MLATDDLSLFEQTTTTCAVTHWLQMISRCAMAHWLEMISRRLNRPLYNLCYGTLARDDLSLFEQTYITCVVTCWLEMIFRCLNRPQQPVL